MGILDAILMDDDDWTPRNKRDNRSNRSSQNKNRTEDDPLDTSIDLDFND